MNYKIWCDLDGVLVHLHKGCFKLFNLPELDNQIYDRECVQRHSGLRTSAMLDAMDAAPGFWENLEPTLTATQIINHLDINFPDWGILTSATHGPASWSGKAAWVKKYLGTKGLHRLVICCAGKARFAHPKAVLIDDWMHNIQAWTDAGGQAFHYPAFSNDLVDLHQERFNALTQYLEQFR